MISDTSVARNFAVLRWTDALITLSGGSLRLAEGVVGINRDEPGEIERAKSDFDEEAERSTLAPASRRLPWPRAKDWPIS